MTTTRNTDKLGEPETAMCPRCGCASAYPGTVVWCAQCGWLDGPDPSDKPTAVVRVERDDDYDHGERLVTRRTMFYAECEMCQWTGLGRVHEHDADQDAAMHRCPSGDDDYPGDYDGETGR